MARPISNGLPYIGIPTNWHRIAAHRILRAKLGDTALTLWLTWYVSCFGINGYYLDFPEEEVPLTAAEYGVTEDYVRELLALLASGGLINGDLLRERHILTSRDIQFRYQEAVKKRGAGRRVSVERAYWLLREEETLPFIAFTYDEPPVPDKVVAAPVSAPETEGFAPKTEGFAPKTEGSASEVEGSAPEVEDSAPEVEGSAPEVEGSASETEDSAPEVEGSASEVEGSASEVGVSVPETLGFCQQKNKKEKKVNKTKTVRPIVRLTPLARQRKRRPVRQTGRTTGQSMGRRCGCVIRLYEELCGDVLPPPPKATPRVCGLIRRGALAGVTMKDYRAAFLAVRESTFLREGNGRWRASFLWLCTPEKLRRVLAGEYRDYAPRGESRSAPGRSGDVGGSFDTDEFFAAAVAHGLSLAESSVGGG